MTAVQTTAPMLNDYETEQEVTLRHGVREISDGAARTIASWWHSPGPVGKHLATLSCGLPVEYDDLANDIHATRSEANLPDDLLALDMLSTWALDQMKSTEEREYLREVDEDDARREDRDGLCTCADWHFDQDGNHHESCPVSA